MNIGQIVFVSDSKLPDVQIGIVTKREKEDRGMYFWYEILCNDGQNHVIPDFLLSPAQRRIHLPYIDAKNNLQKSEQKSCSTVQKHTPAS